MNLFQKRAENVGIMALLPAKSGPNGVFEAQITCCVDIWRDTYSQKFSITDGEHLVSPAFWMCGLHRHLDAWIHGHYIHLPHQSLQLHPTADMQTSLPQRAFCQIWHAEHPRVAGGLQLWSALCTRTGALRVTVSLSSAGRDREKQSFLLWAVLSSCASSKLAASNLPVAACPDRHGHCSCMHLVWEPDANFQQAFAFFVTFPQGPKVFPKLNSYWARVFGNHTLGSGAQEPCMQVLRGMQVQNKAFLVACLETRWFSSSNPC